MDVGDGGRSTVEKRHAVDAFDRRTHAGTWTAVLADELARLLGVDTVTGSYAWDGELVYAVLALESSR